MTKHGKAIYDSIVNHPGDWLQTEYTFDNKKAGISLWTRNIPFIDFTIYQPQNASWSWHDKIMIYLAVRTHRAAMIIKKLKESK